MVTLTHEPNLDDIALKRSLKSKCFYIGALGSKKTHKKRIERFLADTESNRHSINDILQESLDHELYALSLYKKLLESVENASIYLEEYSRNMIGQEEQHSLELKKMLKDFSIS